MSYTEKISQGLYEGIEADQVLSKIIDKLGPSVHDRLDAFTESINKDDTFRPHGELLHSFSIDGMNLNKNKENNKIHIISASIDNKEVRNFEVYKADMSIPGFKEHHERFRTFVLWYIDAANFVDIDDDQWEYFTM